MWPQAIIQIYTCTCTIQSLSVGLAQSTSTGNSQWQTVKQSCKHADGQSSLILLCDNSNLEPEWHETSTRLYSKLAWYETRVLDAFPLLNYTKICVSHLSIKAQRHVCVEHRTTVVESKICCLLLLCIFCMAFRQSPRYVTIPQ